MWFNLLASASLAVCVAALPQIGALSQKRASANVYTHCTVPNTVALTFDDGPYDYIYDISKTLIDNGARGTFLFNGKNYRCIYDVESAKRVKFVYDQGHQVASHTWSHSDLTKLSYDQISNEIYGASNAVKRITGANPAFVRPPFGYYNDQVLQAAAALGQDVANWDFDSGDSVGVSPSDSKKIYSDIANQHPSTILALNHETDSTSAQVKHSMSTRSTTDLFFSYDVLPYAIQVLKAKGYNLVTLADCLGKPKYQSVGAPQERTADWHC